MKRPWWFTVIIIALLAPLAAYPWLVAATAADEPVQQLVRFYPIYTLVAALCAWLAYPRRPEVSWILVAILVLSHAGVYYLAYAAGAAL